MAVLFLQESPGWSVVIENRTGANGNIAAAEVAKAPPDGYTLLLGADSGITINPHVYANLPFDPLKDLAPVASLATNQFMMSAHPDLPIKTFQDFIDYARKTKPPLPYASGRQRQPASADHGDAQAARRHRPPARAVPRRRAGGHRDDRRRHQGAVLGHRQRSDHRVGAIARTRGERQASLEAFPEPADGRRVLSRRRDRHLARPVRRRPARRSRCWPPAHRSPQGHKRGRTSPRARVSAASAADPVPAFFGCPTTTTNTERS